MFPSRYFAAHYFAPRYFPTSGVVPAYTPTPARTILVPRGRRRIVVTAED